MRLDGDTLKALGYLTIFAGVGIYLFFNGFKKWRRKRFIENIPTSKIRSMAMGLVEISGEAESYQGVLKGPLSSQDCVFYKYLIERYERRGKNSRWVKVASMASFQHPFYLNDGTDKVLIDPQDAELNMGEPDFSFETGMFGGEYPTNLLNFLIQNNIRYESLFGKNKMRFKEWDIYPKQIVYVLGSAQKSEIFVTDFKSRLNEKLRQIKTNSEEMKRIDTNQDGTVTIDEWQQAVQNIQQKMLEEELTKPQPSPESNMVITKGTEEKLFIISEKSEKELCKTLSWQAILAIFGGAILAIICLNFLLSILNQFSLKSP